MIKKFAQFWIENVKVTIVFLLITIFAGIGSYIILPKQYNPDIPVPAFNIIVPAPGFSTNEVKNLVVEPLEDKIAEIKDIDHIYGVANKDFGVITVQFNVGFDKEKATTRLYNKIFENLGQKPLGVKDPIIKKMDPDDFPIYTFAIYKDKNELTGGKYDLESQIKLRKIGYDVANKLKFIDGTSMFYLVGGYKDQLNIILDLDKLKGKNIDIMQVYQAIQKNNIVFPGGELKLNKVQSSISINGNLADLDKLKKLIIGNYNGKPIYLQEVASIFKGVNEITHYTYVSLSKNLDGLKEGNKTDNKRNLEGLKEGNKTDEKRNLDGLKEGNKTDEKRNLEGLKEGNKTDEKRNWQGLNNNKLLGNSKNAVFIGIAKTKGVNAVSLVAKIKKELSEIEKTLPDGYKVIEIADEGKVAKNSTNALLINLAESVFIVFLVLLFYLGKKDAINNAFAIPLTLFMVFLIAFILGDNINRIVLFALVLALGMLVDNSTVVIENISRHLKERKEGETVKQAILNAVDEVGVGVVLATITRVLALVAMFFVTGMMGEYMGGVPKYVIISLVVSLLIAFSINPFLAYIFNKNQKDIKKEDVKKIEKKGKLDILYENFMSKFLGEKRKFNRFLFKLFFWLSLGAVLVLPPMFNIFKMAMLPKDNKNQVYIWIDGQKNWTVQKSKEVADYVDNLLTKYKAEKQDNVKDDKIVKNISYWIGTKPVTDFSNAFRGIDFRQMPNQISMRVNLLDKNKREVSSIYWTMKIRNYLKENVLKKYPDAKIRVLEDPAGPPVRASFMIKVEGERDINYKELETLTKWLKDKLTPLFKEDDVVDVYTTVDTYKTNYNIEIDHQLLSSYGLDVQQVAYTIYNIFNGANVSLIHNEHTKEPLNIYLSVKNSQKYNPDIFNEITFMNTKGQKIYLNQFAKITPKEQEHTIYTEDIYQTAYIYGEVGNNSVWYPALHTTLNLIKDDFYEGQFKVISFNPYTVKIKSLKDGQVFNISWGGERKISLDTFRDLGIAMIMALLAIYFLMVAQFKSFKIGGIIMMTFLIGLFGIMPGFSLVYILSNGFFTAPSMIGVIALAGIVVGNAIILLEYLNVLLKSEHTRKIALIKAGQTRMRAIIITSLTTVLGSLTILGDPVWGGLGWSIVWGLSVSAILTLIVIPIFLYDALENTDQKGVHKIKETVNIDY